MRVVHSLMLMGAVACLASCKREERAFRVPPPSAEAAEFVQVSELEPGGKQQPQHVKNQLEANAYAMTEGQHLYEGFNCVGCHSHGGGGMGPPLMDKKWIYGSEPEQIYATIIEGRPNGMPSFRGKIPNNQVWQIVGYVRSLSGLANKDAAPGRDDHMKGATPPNSTTQESPVQSTEPPSAQQ